LCDRWFCERHIEPRLAFIKDLEAIDKIPEMRTLYETEVQFENGHPDFEYSRRKLTELDIEERRRNELIKQAMDRMNQYYKERKRNQKQETQTKTEIPTTFVLEGKTTTKQTYEKQRTRSSIPIKKIVAVVMIVAISVVLFWYSPIIFDTFFKGSSYTELTVMNNAIYSNTTSIHLGGIDYFFGYMWQPSLGFGHLSMWNSLVESTSYNLTEGATYRDFGIETRVKEIRPEFTVLLVKPTVQNYLGESGFTKLTIAKGQFQTVSFSGNNYTISSYDGHIGVVAPLFQFRDYRLDVVPTIIHCDLGLEIRVSDITIEYVIIFVKPLYQ
jgi:hypothetical protein